MSCLVWRSELNRPDKCVQRRSVSGGAGTAGATAGRTPTQNALVRRSGRLSSHRLTRHRQQHCLVVFGGRCELRIKRTRTVVHYFIRATLCQRRTSYGTVSVSVCLSVKSWYCVETDGLVELLFGT